MEVRTELKKIFNERCKFTATFSRTGSCKVCNKVKTVLLLNVQLDNRVLTDHVWIDRNEFKKINFKNMNNKNIQFVATVNSYCKRDENNNIVVDYCLTNIKYPKWI